MPKKLKWVGIILVVLFLAAQLYQPERSNPPIDESKTIYASLNVPPEVKTILERSCSDCHSHSTRWPWYSYVAPTSWLTTGDVKNGRATMNLSLWGTYKKTRQVTKLNQISDQLADDKMPLKPYRLMHPNSVLSKQEVDLISRWAEKESSRLSEPDSSDTSGKRN
jgi:hypothetical protein